MHQDIQRKFDKIIDLKMPTMENILAFYNQVNNPFITNEMVFSKISKAAKLAICLALQNKPPNVWGHQFTTEDCKEWYLDPLLKRRYGYNPKTNEPITVSFNQSSEESVTATVISIYTHLDEDKLPALAKTSGFQNKMVELLND